MDDIGGSTVLADDPQEFDMAGTYRLQMQDWLQEWYDLPGGRPVGTA